MNIFFKIQHYITGIQFCTYKLSYDIFINFTRYIKGNGIKIIGYGVASFFLYNLTNNFYLKYIDTNSINNDDDKHKDIPYSMKYYDTFKDYPSEKLSKDYIKCLLSNIVFEPTPKGNVIMYYDYNNESFIYYSDVKDIPYLYLETVARKYAITFNCKELVVDMKKEIENATTKNKENKNNNNNKNNKENNNGIFASFKSYRIGNNSGNNSGNKKYIIPESSNRYSYNGKIKEYNFLNNSEYKIEKLQDKIDYKTWKNKNRKYKMKKN